MSAIRTLVRNKPSKMAAAYILRCQEDSHLRRLEGVRVLACEGYVPKASAKPAKKSKAKDPPSGDQQEQPQPAFRVQLEQTVLFPEGGGQPYDKGFLRCGEDQVPVLEVERVADGSTWHSVPKELQVGDVVDVEVDWARRFDHMQCHTGQHLITAVAHKTLGLPTAAWSLTMWPQPCTLDLEGKLDQESLVQLEADVNQAILDNHPVSSKVYTPEEFANLDDVRFKAIDTEFPIRTVEIQGLDVNTCCGTHVKSLSELQMIQLVKTERMSGGGITRVHFVAGKRLANFSRSLLEVSKELTDVLKCGPEQFVTRVDGLVQAQKQNTKSTKIIMKELGELSGAQAVRKALEQGSKVVSVHHRHATSEFVQSFVGAVTAANLTGLVTTGDESAPGGGQGTYVLLGPKESSELLASANEKVTAALQAKGGGKGNKFQGKILPGKLTADAIKKAQQDLQEVFAST